MSNSTVSPVTTNHKKCCDFEAFAFSIYCRTDVATTLDCGDKSCVVLDHATLPT